MQICILGSGSSGNSTLLRLGSRAILIDAGFGPRAILKRLNHTGISLNDIHAILLTHLDRDHFNLNWPATLLRHSIRLYCHERHLYQLYRIPSTSKTPTTPQMLHREKLLFSFQDRSFDIQLSDHRLNINPIRFDHDRAGTVGFRISAADHALAFATDLGRIPDSLIDHFTNTDFLAIESNYDPTMQLASDRPDALKCRIMNGAGHLSNEQAFSAVLNIVEKSDTPPAHIIKLHLSRQCNDPRIVADQYRQHPNLAKRLTIADQFQPSGWLSPDGSRKPIVGEQLQMFTSQSDSSQFAL